MKAFIKTLFGDTWNIIGVTLIVVVALALTGLGHAGWAVFAMPVAGLGVVAWLARH
jgi:hypothetical protein